MSNNDSIEVSSSTVEQAISEALAQLGAAHDDVVIEVLATPRSGVLGLGARDARVRVSRRNDVAATSGVTAPPPAPPPQRRDAPAAQRREQPTVQHTEPPKREVPAPVAGTPWFSRGSAVFAWPARRGSTAAPSAGRDRPAAIIA